MYTFPVGIFSGESIQVPLAPPSGLSSTVAARGSVYLRREDSQHYTVADNAAFDIGTGDFSISILARADYILGSAIQYFWNHGNSGAINNVQIYLSGTTWTGVARSSGSAVTVTNSRAQVRGEWVLVTLKRASGNVSLDVTPQGGATTVGTGSALSGAISPSGTAYIGARFDLLAARFARSCISYVFYTGVALDSTQQANLAAGQDPVADLGLSCPVYIRMDTASSTLANSGNGGALTITRVNGAVSKGAPIYAGSPITISASIDEIWGFAYQRDKGDTARTMRFSGTYRDNPTRIECRVIDGSGNVVVDWTPATAYPSAGNWQCDLRVPDGVKYTLEARHSNDTTKFSRTIKPWGVGVVNMLGGESIADQQRQGTFTEAGFAPDRDTFALINGADAWANNTAFALNAIRTDPVLYTVWVCTSAHTSPVSGTFAADRTNNPGRWRAATLTDLYIDTLNADNGTVVSFAGRYTAVTGRGMTVANGAKSGSKLFGGAPNNWVNLSADTYGKYRGTLTMIGGDFELLSWYQGANDGNDGSVISTAQYQGGLETLLPIFRTDTNRTAAQQPILIAIVGTNTNNASQSANDQNWRNVAVAQANVVDGQTVTNVIDANVMHDITHVDGLHPDNAGYLRIGKRALQAFLNYQLPGSYNNVRGGRMASAAISAADTIRVTFELFSGTALGGISSSTGIVGFIVRNGSNVVQTITAAVISGATTVDLTVAGAAPSWTVDYAGTQNPMNGATQANLLVTNATVTGDIIGPGIRRATAPLVL